MVRETAIEVEEEMHDEVEAVDVVNEVEIMVVQMVTVARVKVMNLMTPVKITVHGGIILT